jgi:ATP-binding cassette, subfamily A (ABC1), member 3
MVQVSSALHLRHHQRHHITQLTNSCVVFVLIGKTTTMQMLTAEFPPSSGDATLAGFSVTQEPEKTRRRVGYCPQFDAHFANMTGREHVELYATIKGVPKKLVKEASVHKLAEVGLSPEDSDRLSAGYSGGMKRRLSLACATIGQPQIVFLDECSTGVDPVARREIWQMVSDMVTGGNCPPEERPSVILTTHSMEECEALCPNIGIMAGGKLRCLGSAQHLKSKFGQGYQVEMKIKAVEQSDSDYLANYAKIAAAVGASTTPAQEEEGGIVFYLDLEKSKFALQSLTNDDYLSGMIIQNNAQAYIVYREASSPTGVGLHELTNFATNELRMRSLNDFVAESYPNSLVRERQDQKARYEVSSQGVKIANIFASIEGNKDRLLVAEYGVSQTSLEQVFNMHAAVAEKLKHGTNDG